MSSIHSSKKLLTLCVAAIFSLFAVGSFGSGSVGGGGGISQFGQVYKQGKTIFFQKITCDRSECSYRRSQLDENLARDLVESLRTVDALSLTESETDQAIEALSSDEIEPVEYYLARRFRI